MEDETQKVDLEFGIDSAHVIHGHCLETSVVSLL